MSVSSAIPAARTSNVAASAGIGTFIEWYDFGLYSSASALIFSKLFFGNSGAEGLLATFATFAVGYFARPFGAIIFAHLGDRFGRKPILVATLIIMALSTAAMGALPTYAAVGATAPILLVAVRIIQGLGAGAEFAGAMTMSAEWASAKRRGFFATFPVTGLWIGLTIGVLTFETMKSLTGPSFYTWGWRLPFLVSIALLAVALYIRSRVGESPEFLDAAEAGAIRRFPLGRLLRTEKRRLAVGLGSNVLLSGFAYVPQVWALSYLTNNLGIASGIALLVNVLMFALGVPELLLFGALGDRIGRRRLYMGATAFEILWTVPMFLLINTRSTPLIFMALLVCWAGIAAANAAQGGFLTELFPKEIRFTSIAVSREITAGVLGGLAPLIATALYTWTQQWWPIAFFMVACALATLVALFFSKPLRSDAEQLRSRRIERPSGETGRAVAGSAATDV